ncbi:MAG TPA: glycosyltransferase family 2 protein [Bacteroidota bacterium]|nr:glycosyltransferase family 2 protein [Bacteroidota bacterium]
MQRISVVVVTFNEERNIERCLASVQWADEIIVVDAFSTDRTLEICRRLKATVVQREWQGYAPQKQFAISSASHEWVLLVDADEEVPEELRREIEETLHSQQRHTGFRIARKSFFLGQWMRYGGWFPGYQLRLFLGSKASIPQRAVHEGVEVAGPVGTLRAPLNHFTYYSLAQYLSKLNDYTSLDVTNRLNEKGDRSVHWFNFILNPFSVFVRMFIVLGGFRDGFRGFLLAVYSSFYKLVLLGKVWEFQAARARGAELPPVSSESLNSIKRLS